MNLVILRKVVNKDEFEFVSTNDYNQFASVLEDKGFDLPLCQCNVIIKDRKLPENERNGEWIYCRIDIDKYMPHDITIVADTITIPYLDGMDINAEAYPEEEDRPALYSGRYRTVIVNFEDYNVYPNTEATALIFDKEEDADKTINYLTSVLLEDDVVKMTPNKICLTHPRKQFIKEYGMLEVRTR